VVTPLFSAFGPEPIATRAEMGDARVLVTTSELYKRKVQGLRSRLPGLHHVIVVGDAGDDETGMHRWNSLLGSASMALLHCTSGTTGRPKGAVHVHGTVVAHMATGRFARDLHENDVFWCTADPGWSRPSSMRRPGTPCSNASASPSGTRRRQPFA